MKRCVMCGEHGEPPARGMCRLCQRSYDETAHRMGCVWEAMAWAARRARRFERKRARERDVRPCNSFMGTDEMGSVRCVRQLGHKGAHRE